VFVAGTSVDNAGNRRNATVAYDAATGAKRWVARSTPDDDVSGDGIDNGVSGKTKRHALQAGGRWFEPGTAHGGNAWKRGLLRAYRPSVHVGNGHRDNESGNSPIAPRAKHPLDVKRGRPPRSLAPF
jgi:hypothetical protein